MFHDASTTIAATTFVTFVPAGARRPTVETRQISHGRCPFRLLDSHEGMMQSSDPWQSGDRLLAAYAAAERLSLPRIRFTGLVASAARIA
jgi:hypothetical protein